MTSATGQSFRYWKNGKRYLLLRNYEHDRNQTGGQGSSDNKQDNLLQGEHLFLFLLSQHTHSGKLKNLI
jgi:hypothetical protein